MRFLKREEPPTDADRLSVQLRTVRALLESTQRVLVLTGAGISVGAGLPTFRGPGGLYDGPEGSQRSCTRKHFPARWRPCGSSGGRGVSRCVLSSRRPLTGRWRRGSTAGCAKVLGSRW